MRFEAVHLHSAKKRSASSQRWLTRQLNDPYVQQAQALGYRSRAAFKLRELDDKWHFLKPGLRIVDLGAAPGGWCQVAVERANPTRKGGQIIGIDLLPIDPLEGVTFLQGNFLEEDVVAQIKALLSGPIDLVLSDMAAAATGHTLTDHIRIMGLAEAAFHFAQEVLTPGGGYIAKTLQGGTEKNLLNELKRSFRQVVHAKPPASRSGSAEMYVLAFGFRG